MLNSFLSEVMTLVGFGAFLDTVLIGKKEREKIERYLDDAPEAQTLTERFLRFLSLSHSVVFDRFFSGNLFSLSFFASAATISVTSFIAVSFFQIYFDSSALSSVQFDFLQISLIVAFIAFNALFDYFTIIQTKLFIEASISAKSIFRSLVFIGSDLMVTMNTFILSYAFFVLLVVQYFVWPNISISYIRATGMENNVTEISAPPSYLTEIGTPDALKRMKFRDNFSGAIFAKGQSSDRMPVTIYYESTIDPRKVELQTLLLATLPRMQVVQTRGIEKLHGDNPDDLAEFILNETGPNRFNRKPQNTERDQFPDLEGASFDVTGKIRDLGALDAAYSLTFSQTDALEDGFPASIFGKIEILNLKRFVSDTMSNEALAAPIAICIRESGVMTRFMITRENISTLDDCKDFITSEFVWRMALTRDLAVIGRNLSDRIVPYNTLLITSLLPTLLFYLVIILMAVSTFVFSFVIRGTKKVKIYFLRAPLTIACFVVAIPLVALGFL